jgi:antitoxin component YwqK of YwqJK toxin-antitoxin module
MNFLEAIASNLTSGEFRNFAVLFPVKPKFRVENNRLKSLGDTIYRTLWDRGFKISEGGYILKLKSGKWFDWTRAGVLFKSEIFLNGEKNGLATSWYPNGRKKTEFTYRNGKLEGPSTFWSEVKLSETPPSEHGRYMVQRLFRNNQQVGVPVETLIT